MNRHKFSATALLAIATGVASGVCLAAPGELWETHSTMEDAAFGHMDLGTQRECRPSRWRDALVGVGRAGGRTGAARRSIQVTGGPPTAEQSDEIRRLQARLAGATSFAAGFLYVAAVMMATARYL